MIQSLLLTLHSTLTGARPNMTPLNSASGKFALYTMALQGDPVGQWLRQHQQDDTQLEYWKFWSCWATSPSQPRL